MTKTVRPHSHTDTGLRADDKTYATVTELLDRWVYLPKDQSQLVRRPVLISTAALILVFLLSAEPEFVLPIITQW